MNLPKLCDVAASPLGVPLNLLRTTDQPAKIQILHDVTSDCPDGRPWPPPEGTALWAIVRRADGCTFWRAIQLAQVRSAAADLCNSCRQQPNLKR
jgi:hypothetical protein